MEVSEDLRFRDRDGETRGVRVSVKGLPLRGRGTKGEPTLLSVGPYGSEGPPVQIFHFSGHFR